MCSSSEIVILGCILQQATSQNKGIFKKSENVVAFNSIFHIDNKNDYYDLCIFCIFKQRPFDAQQFMIQ